MTFFAEAEHVAGEPRRAIRWPAGSVVTADFSDCKRYRYSLIEQWTPRVPGGARLCMWLLMNPSTAGLRASDPTLAKTGRYARRWGYDGQIICNTFAYRATDQRRLAEIDDPVGPRNGVACVAMARRAEIIVLAYGTPSCAKYRGHGGRWARWLADQDGNLKKMRVLRLSKEGIPVHPLYLPGELLPEPVFPL